MTRDEGRHADSASFANTMLRLRDSQKNTPGGPPYSLFVNRRIGRVFAAASYELGMSPNQVTGLSALFTFVGIGVLALAPPTWLAGLVVALLLLIGYALDSADGQLARLQGRSSLSGEWLDHTVDSVKVGMVHVAVLMTWYLHFDLDVRWLLVPLGFAIVSEVHFFGMILVDLLSRARLASLRLPPTRRGAVQLSRSLSKLPTDYGVFCLVTALLGSRDLFVALYGLLALATLGYTVLVVFKWRRDVLALDALQPSIGQ